MHTYNIFHHYYLYHRQSLPSSLNTGASCVTSPSLSFLLYKIGMITYVCRGLVSVKVTKYCTCLLEPLGPFAPHSAGSGQLSEHLEVSGPASGSPNTSTVPGTY